MRQRTIQYLTLLAVLAWSAMAMAANNYWLGAANDVKQVDTITASGGPWTAGKGLTVTCNNKTVTVTLQSSLTASDAVAAMSAAINASSATADLVNDETRNRGGQELGEFRDIVASASGAVLTLTSTTAGVPFTVTASDDDASGVFTTVTSVTVATGKNWADNVDNWSLGALGTSDILVFRDGSVDVLYGLDNTGNVAGVERLGSYTGDIGLLRTNSTHSGYPYYEYRTRHLTANSTAGYCQVYVGDGTGVSTGRTHLSLGQASVRIDDTATADTNGVNPIELVGSGNPVVVVLFNGAVDVGERGVGGDISVESYEQSGGSCRFEAIILAASSLHMTGGTFTTDVAMSNFSTQLQLDGGTMTLREESGCADIEVNGGTLDYQAGTISTIEVRGDGVVTFDNDPETKSVTDIKLHKGATLKDTFGVAVPSGDYHFIDCQPSDVTLTLPKNYKLSPTAL